MALFGLTRQKPRHYREMLRIVWENRRALPFAWRILSRGVCDGCALGTTGLRDWTLPGTHLCMVRLELMGLNTASAIDPRTLADVEPLRKTSSRDLRALGRLAVPMVRRAGARGFEPLSWNEALDLVAREIRATTPDRVAFYLTSRGITNETYYAAQKAARWIGTNHVDNAARLCHAASTVAMKAMLGHGASTCSYTDWIGADLLVFFGSNVANNQPVTMKYIHAAKARGAQVVVVNPYREPGMETYWIPSVAKSALLGTSIADRWVDVHTGGDLAFLVGVLRALVERGGVDRQFIDACTDGFDAAAEAATATAWEDIEVSSGVSKADIDAFAQLLVDRPNAVFVWSMGLTQNVRGVETVKALVNIGLARGLVGRANRGLVPIRGHSGVQGGAEVGCIPNLDADASARFAHAWGVQLPQGRGWTAGEMVAHAADGDVDVFWMTGGNFLETLGDEARSRRALARPRLRVHQDIVLSSSMLAPSEGDVLLLPATTRYESQGGGTETSTERRIIFSPEIPGRRIGEARPEWWAFRELARRVRPHDAARLGLDDAAATRAEIARTVPLYAGIETLARQGDQVQWGGRHLFADGRFHTSSGRAQFATVHVARAATPREGFLLSTRRGKQFNSMVQRDVDPLTGADRDHVLVSAADVAHLGLRENQRVTLRSPEGTLAARVRTAPIRPGNLEVHWPEGNVLLGEAYDPDSMEPDYNAVVQMTAEESA